MAERYERLVRSSLTPAAEIELAFVDQLAASLRRHLDASLRKIDVVHVHGAASKAVQDIVSVLLKGELGFGEEVVLKPEDGLVAKPRPDFVFRLGDGRGIIAEVERGGTTTNNHDLKDLWKAHVAHDVQHLFLVVPLANWNAAGASRERPFHQVVRRLGAFFGDPRREVDVDSAHIFGYGSPHLGGG